MGSFEYIIAEYNDNYSSSANGKDIQLIINTHVEASKIGRQIAEQVIDSHRRGGESSSGSSPDPDPESSLSLPIPSAEVLQPKFFLENQLLS